MLKSIYSFHKWRNAVRLFVFGIFLFMPIGVFGASSSVSVTIAQPSTLSDCVQALDKSGPQVLAYAKTIDSLLQQSFFPYDKDVVALSPACNFSFPIEGETGFFKKKVIIFSYTKTPYRPRIYEWSNEKKEWHALPSVMNRTTRTVSIDVEKNSVVLAAFADGKDSYEGTASWYAHKRYPEGSATNLFPIGTKLKVINTSNNKSTAVTVTSTWTNNDEKRIIDLVSTAFKKIAKLGEGLIKVKIERIE